MFGFGFALVPFYEKICRALGVNSLVERNDAPTNTQVDTTRTVTIEFDANSHNLPWRFRALTPHIDVHPGELVQVEYEVANDAARRSPARRCRATARARRAVLPQARVLLLPGADAAAGETRRMPVVFVVDPTLPEDVHTITLSYTFFEVAGLKGKS